MILSRLTIFYNETVRDCITVDTNISMGLDLSQTWFTSNRISFKLMRIEQKKFWIVLGPKLEAQLDPLDITYYIAHTE